jgi:hypothetical protein
MECGVSGLHVDLLEFSVKIFFLLESEYFSILSMI